MQQRKRPDSLTCIVEESSHQQIGFAVPLLPQSVEDLQTMKLIGGTQARKKGLLFLAQISIRDGDLARANPRAQGLKELSEAINDRRQKFHCPPGSTNNPTASGTEV